MSDESYVLGHTERELDRLDFQGELYRHATRSAFVDAGIVAGMRVLDVGCGSGDVSRLAAELVGPSGHVLGVDRDHNVIASARARTSTSQYPQVDFAVAEADAALTERFDALVGRFVLMHQTDPAAMLRSAAAHVKSDGVVLMVESHMGALLGARHSFPYSETYDEMVRWKCAAVKAAGADTEAGLRLRQTYLHAGLPEPTIRMEAPVEGGADSRYYRYMIESIRSMLPRAIAGGVTGMTEDRLDFLEAQLRHEVVSQDGSLTAWPVVAAWCRVP